MVQTELWYKKAELMKLYLLYTEAASGPQNTTSLWSC